MDIILLKELGLTEGEIKVYIALTELGLSTHGYITKESGVSASKVYKILDRLIKKGLVSYVLKGKTKYFSSAGPEKLGEYYKAKIEDLRKKEEPLKKVIQELELKQELREEKTSTVVYEEYEGLKTVYNELLEKLTPQDTFIAYGIPPANPTIQRYFVRFFKALEQKKVASRVIYNDDAKQTARERTKGMKYAKYRLIDGPTPATTAIVKNQTIISVRTIQTPINIVITNKEIADSNRTYFEYLWKNAKEDKK